MAEAKWKALPMMKRPLILDESMGKTVAAARLGVSVAALPRGESVALRARCFGCAIADGGSVATMPLGGTVALRARWFGRRYGRRGVGVPEAARPV